MKGWRATVSCRLDCAIKMELRVVAIKVSRCQHGKQRKVLGSIVLKHFKALCSQVTINWWNPKLTRKALDDLLVLTGQTSISTYACNMNPEAAFTLHRYLTELGIIR